jgi:hypothetical protein
MVLLSSKDDDVLEKGSDDCNQDWEFLIMMKISRMVVSATAIRKIMILGGRTEQIWGGNETFFLSLLILLLPDDESCCRC